MKRPMQPRILGLSALVLTLSVALSTTASAQASPVVEVSFEKPEGFTDAYPRSRSGSSEELQETLNEVTRLFTEQAARHLKAGDRLKVTITDLDLAGEIEPGRTGAMSLRVLRPINWPRMSLRYTFTRDGKASSAEAKLSDPGYQDNSGTCARVGGLCYEKQMVGRWMQRQFG
ncbi:MAG: DUF3016 domain-containing protein [Burkholderiales bacterium]|nr:DUF3016 domain-containing protein [Burkholderiales bacterium]